MEALFDIKIIDTDAPPCTHASNTRIKFGHRGSRKEEEVVEDKRGTFTLFVTSVDGLLHRQKHIATSIVA